MDTVSEIKMRLPIEQLVGQYCQLQKKGRNFVCLCPFHNDSHPSFLVSPDKGIAYCFACRSGGDIFSFYQKIEGIEFPQALKELAEKTGVVLQETEKSVAPKRDEKDRARACLEAAAAFYQRTLTTTPAALDYVRNRGVPEEQVASFRIGVAPDSFSATYEHLLKMGFSRKEILAAGMCVQRDLNDERMYDRFRNRLMFPIEDQQGHLVGFGGRTLGADDAKYINTSESILFHKSEVLFGIRSARDAIRERNCVLLVEGYFDVLACHRAGAVHAVATCGTALTEGHVKILRRYCDRVTLCFDSDRAGKDAAERSFHLLVRHGMHVDTIVLPRKDPADVILEGVHVLTELLAATPVPYIDSVLQSVTAADVEDPLRRRDLLQKITALLQSLPSTVERQHAVERAAIVFRTTPIALEDDLIQAARVVPSVTTIVQPSAVDLFSSIEIALALFILYPDLTLHLPELIEPEDEFPRSLLLAMRALPPDTPLSVGALSLTPPIAERLGVLLLYCEQHGLSDWSPSLADRELRKHIVRANRDLLRRKQEQITRELLLAASGGNQAEMAQLQRQMQHVLTLLNRATTFSLAGQGS